MDSIEKIRELLEKKNLSGEEKLQLDALIKNDPEGRELYGTHQKLACYLKSKHISSDDLGNYLLYKNNIEPEDTGIIEKIPQIEFHLQSCSQCTDELKFLNEEYSEVDIFIADKFKTVSENQHDEIPAAYKISKIKRLPLYLVSSVFTAGLLYLSLLFISDLTTPDIYELASVSDKSEYYITRGRATSEFQESVKALEENNFDRAIEFLESDINNNPDDQTIFYSHYILGLTYLEKADKSFIGLLRSFNNNDASSGLKNLQLCIEKNVSGKFPDITNNAYFYSAKANLMLENTKPAKEYLTIVIDQKGSKMTEAQNLLSELE